MKITIAIGFLSFILGMCVMVAGVITGHGNECGLWMTVSMLLSFPAGMGARVAYKTIEGL